MAFVTAGFRDSASTNIADYNTFVTQQAALSTSLPTGVTWRAIGSTATVYARDNAPTYADIPIYNTRGQRVANSGPEVWDPFAILLHPIGYDQYGSQAGTVVMTGTYPPGVKSNTPLGYYNPEAIFSKYRVTAGQPPLLHYGLWYDSDEPGGPNPIFLPMYALSSPITVIPEPSTLVLWSGLGAMGLVMAWRKRNQGG